MNILLVANILGDKGGAERVAYNTAVALNDIHNISVLTTDISESLSDVKLKISKVPYKNIEDFKIGKLKAGVLKKICWHAINSISGVSYDDILKVFDSQEIDLVYCHNSHLFQPQLYRACIEANIPYVVHLHDYSYICPRASMFKNEENCKSQCSSCKLFTLNFKKALKSAAKVISVSEFVANTYMQEGYLINEQVEILNNVTAPINIANQQNGGDSYGFIGAINKDKGVEYMLDAFIDTDLTLFIAGDGDELYVKKLKEKYASENIVWLGYSSLDDFYSKVNILIVPSLWNEPQALVITEAINRKVPILASAQGGNIEVLNKYKAGFLFDPQKGINELKNLLASLTIEKLEQCYQDIPYNSMTNNSIDYYTNLNKILCKAASNEG